MRSFKIEIRLLKKTGEKLMRNYEEQNKVVRGILGVQIKIVPSYPVVIAQCFRRAIPK